MAVNLPPTGGGHQINVDIVFRIHQAGLQEAGRALQQFGFQHMANIGQAQASVAQSQERLQAAFQRSVSGIQALGRETGNYERALRQTVATTESFIRRNMQLTPEQARVFAQQRQQIAGIEMQREQITSLGREATRGAERVVEFNRSLERVARLRAAGMAPAAADPMERRILGRGVGAGIATQEQVNRFRDLEQQFSRTGMAFELMGQRVEVGRIVAWGLAWTAAYQALRLVQAALAELVTGPFRIFAEMQQRQLALAAEIRTLDPSIPFARASQVARALQRALLEIQPGFIGTRQQLQEIALANIRFFGGINLGTQQGRERFLTLANAIQAAQIGINRAGSSFREVAALFEGVLRPGAQFLALLSNINPQIVEQIRGWTTTEQRIKGITDLLGGFQDVAREVANTLQGQINVAMSRWQILMLDIGEATGPIATGFFKIVNAILLAQIKANEFVRDVRGAGENFLRRLVGAQEVQPVDPIVDLQRRRLRDVTLELQKFFATSQGMRVLFQDMFRAGSISADEYADKLREIADVAFQELIAATNQNRAAALRNFVESAAAAKQYRRELQEIKESLSRAREFEIPLQSERDLFRQTELLRGLLGTFPGRTARVRGDPARLEQVEREEAGVREKIRNAGEQIERLRREAAASIRRILRDELGARLIDLSQSETEALRIVGSNEEMRTQVVRRFALERQRIVEDEVRGTLQRLVQLRDATFAAEAEAARARAEVRTQPAEFRRGIADFQIAFLQQSPSPATLDEMQRRFQRIRQLREESAAVQIRAVEEALADQPRTLQTAQFRLQLLQQLRSLLVENAQAQAQLNREQREQTNTALQNEIRLLERRLDVLARIGAPMQEIAGVQERLGRARELVDIRDLAKIPGALQQELGLIQRELQTPGIARQQQEALRRRAALVREVGAEIEQQQRAEGDAQTTTLQKLDTIGKEVQNVLKQVADDLASKAKVVRQEYESIFNFIKSQVEALIRVFGDSGTKSGRAFGEGFLRSIREYLGPNFPITGPQITAPGGPRGELPAPAPAGLIGGIGGGIQVPAPTSGGSASGPINVALSVTGPPQGPTIVVGNLDITPRLSEETISALVAAVLGAQGDVGVKRERRNVPAGGSVV